MTVTEQQKGSMSGQPVPFDDLPEIILRPSSGWLELRLSEVWAYRELLYFLTWRDVKVRYKQTALGVAWIVLQPLVSTGIFSLLFGGLLQVPSGGVP